MENQSSLQNSNGRLEQTKRANQSTQESIEHTTGTLSIDNKRFQRASHLISSTATNKF